jgi:A/G-specific adenine glycosylase
MLPLPELLQFRKQLLSWFAAYRRDLPWRRTDDPYKIWISEVMLQQTRVSAVIPFYERFLARFPTIEALANAQEGDLLANWSGLGYYYRARNLQKAAQQICGAGAFPRTYAEILDLPGVGSYTAAAVTSIAFDQPHAVLDGNVYRVLSRLLDDGTNIAFPKASKHFGALADDMLDRAHPGNWNEAMMELGATICLPKNPRCLLCPAAGFCRARANGRQQQLPVKIKTQLVSKHVRVLFWIERNGSLLLWQRPADSRLMPGFWELPEATQLPRAEPGRPLGSFRHGITTHNYTFDVVEAAVPEDLDVCEWIAEADLQILPLSTVVNKARRVVNKTHSRSSAFPAIAGG